MAGTFASHARPSPSQVKGGARALGLVAEPNTGPGRPAGLTETPRIRPNAGQNVRGHLRRAVRGRGGPV